MADTYLYPSPITKSDMIDLLNYRGDPGLGLGTTRGANAPSQGEDFSQLNKTMQNIMLLDAEKNMKEHDQKIKDRDQLNQLFLEGKVKLGTALPQDKKIFDAQEQAVEKAFLSDPDILNNKASFAKYADEVGKLQQIAAQAQSRWKSFADLNEQKSKETLPWKQQQIQSWIDTQSKKDFWAPIDPYQQLRDMDYNGVNTSGVVPQVTTYNDPKDPTKSYTQTTIDFDDIKRRKALDYMLQNENGYDTGQLQKKVMEMPVQQQMEAFNHINSRIDQYNKERGFIQGQKGWVSPIAQLKDGKILYSEDSAPEFAAKWALAGQSQYTSKTPLLKPEEILKHGEEEQRISLERQGIQLQQQRLNVEMKKAEIDEDAKKAYAAHLKALDNRAGGQDPQLKADVMQKWGKILNGVQFNSQFSAEGDRTNVSNLPEDFQYISGPVIDPKTKQLTVQKLYPFTDESGNSYYKNKYVDPQTGNDVDVYGSEWQRGYRTWIDGGYRGSYEDYLRENMKRGAFEVTLQGQYPKTDIKGEIMVDGKGNVKSWTPGTATLESFYNSERFINDKATRGKESVVEPPPPQE